MNGYTPGIHHVRHSIRLKDYDYTTTGAYFVTISTKHRECILCDIRENEMFLSDKGRVVFKCWTGIPEHFNNIMLDKFVVMPNHIHGIVVIDFQGRGMACHAPTNRQFGIPISNSLSTVVGSFKAAVTKQINHIHNTSGVSIWQRNYYEHIIRNEKELTEIREYIINNPLKWELDKENPENTGNHSGRVK